MDTAKPKISLFPGPRVFARFFNPNWWRHTVKFAWLYKKYLYLPTILSTTASLLATGVLTLMPQVEPGSTVDASTYLPAMLTVMGMLIVAGILYLIVIFVGLVRLAAFCRAFLLCPAGADNQTIIDSHKEAVSSVAHHKGQLAKAWFVASVISIPMLFVLGAAALVAIFLDPQIIAQFGLGKDGSMARAGAMTVVVASYIVLSNYSMTTLAASVLLNRNLGATTRIALILAITASPGLILMTIFDGIFYTLLCTPDAIFQAMDMRAAAAAAMVKPGIQKYLLDIWQGLSSLIVFPVTAALLLEILRDSLALGVED